MNRSEIDIGNLLLSIRRRSAILIYAVATLFLIGLIYTISSAPIYSATTLILFDPSDKNLLDPSGELSANTLADARLNSEIEFIRSNAVLLETVEKAAHIPELAAPSPNWLSLLTQDIRNPSKPTAHQVMHERLSILRRASTIRRIAGTHVISIEVRAQAPHSAAELANVLADAYIAQQVSRKIANLANHRSVLASHLALARDGLVEAETAVDVFLAKTRSEITALDEQSEATTESNLRSQTAPLRELRTGIAVGDYGPALSAELYEVEQSAELARSQYQTLISRLQGLTAQTDLQVADSHIISPAIAPVHPSSPNYFLTLALSLVAGLLAGIALALLYEHLIGGFVSEEQLAGALKLSQANSLPFARGRTDSDSLADHTIDEPDTGFTEAIRRLRATIGFQAPPPTEGCQVIMICSSQTGEGKTTTALALARCFARAGNRTLLIDADLRAPSLHLHLKIGPSLGLSDYLSKSQSKDIRKELVTTDPLSTLSVIVGAQMEEWPERELLSGRKFAALIESARSYYDVLVLDTAAAGEVTDTLYAARLADVAILITKWATTPQQAVRKTIRSLEAASHGKLLILPVLSQKKEREGHRERRTFFQPAQI